MACAGGQLRACHVKLFNIVFVGMQRHFVVFCFL